MFYSKIKKLIFLHFVLAGLVLLQFSRGVGEVYAVCGILSPGDNCTPTSCDATCAASGWEWYDCSEPSQVDGKTWCICDDFSDECTADPGPINCPVIEPIAGCSIGDPFVDCQAGAGSEDVCCSTQEECAAEYPQGPCDPYAANADSTCLGTDAGQCDPDAYEDIPNFQPRCHVDESVDPPTSYCTCTTDEFFGLDGPLCVSGPGQTGIDTAIGCLPVSEVGAFTQTLLRMGIGIAGGLALFLMGLSGILIKLSSGNPERVQSGKELFVAALTGLLLVIFSVFILRLFGVEALAIPNL